MPLYDYECQKCEITEERISSVNETVYCQNCGEPMKRLMPFSHGINMGVGAYGYYDDNLQTYIHSNRQRRDEMKRQGVGEAYGKGWY